MSDDLKFLFDVNSFGDDALEYQLTSLNKSIIDILKDSIDIHGVALFTIDGIMAILIAKNEKHYSNLKQLSETVSQLQPKKYFATLPNEIEYRGPGYMDFTEFEVYFVKISDQLIISFIATDIHFQVFEHTKEIIKSVIKMMETDPEELKKEELRQKETIKDEVMEEQSNEEIIDNKASEIKFKPKKYEDKFAPKRVDPRSLLRPVKTVDAVEKKDDEKELEDHRVEVLEEQSDEKQSEDHKVEVMEEQSDEEIIDNKTSEIKFKPKKYEDKFAPKRVDPRSLLRPVKTVDAVEKKDDEKELEDHRVEVLEEQSDEKQSEDHKVEVMEEQSDEEIIDNKTSEIKFKPKKYEDKFAPKRVDPRSLLRPVKTVDAVERKDDQKESEDQDIADKNTKPIIDKEENEDISKDQLNSKKYDNQSVQSTDPRSILRPVSKKEGIEDEKELGKNDEKSIDKENKDDDLKELSLLLRRKLKEMK